MALFEADVVADSFQVHLGKFFINAERFQTMEPSFLFPVFHKRFCLIEIDVGMVAKALYACTVQVDEADVFAVDVEPRFQPMEIQVDLLQLPDVVEASQALPVMGNHAGNAATDARYLFQLGSVGAVQVDDGACRIFIEMCGGVFAAGGVYNCAIYVVAVSVLLICI